jgi:sodium transport system permease protein
MSAKNTRLIFLREVRDQLRDRRTLFMVAVLPLLLYPALGIGMAQMLNTFSEQTRLVLLVGFDDLPDPPLLSADNHNQKILPAWFTVPADADKLRVTTDAMLDAPPPDGIAAGESTFLAEAVEFRAIIEKLGQLTRKRERLEQRLTDNGKTDELQPEIDKVFQDEQHLKDQVDAWFRTGPAQVLIVVPRGFRQHLDDISTKLAARESIDELIDATPRPVILQNSADEKSMIAARRVREAIRNWDQNVLGLRLQAANLPATLPQAVDSTGVDLAAEEELSATLWSKMFPVLLVMMAVTGAFYPAIDLGAGEKERGTMETLLISPAKRSEIVLGKFFTIMLFSLSTALLNLVSMGLTSKYLLTMAAAGQVSKYGSVAEFPPPVSLFWIVVLAIPLAALFSALSLALAMFARSSKEGQYYLTPLLMVTMGLAIFCVSPSVEINPFYSVYPVVGPGLLLKALLLNQPQPYLLAYIVAVLISSGVYSAMALWWAIEQFKSEEVLFREAERFDLRAWFRHILRDREPTPSFTESGFCLVLILLLQFASFGVLSVAFEQSESAAEKLRLQIMYLLVTVGTPPLIMAAMLTSSVRDTLKIRWPGWKSLGVAVALPITLLPLSMEILGRLDWFFPEPPKGVQEMLASLGKPEAGWLLPLLAFAVAPAICEELAFRGFILSGLQRARNVWVPILLSSFAFGIIHMVPQQVFNASLLGIVIALLAITSRSLLPGVLFHFLFNGSYVLLERIGPDTVDDFASRAGPWIVQTTRNADGQLESMTFGWPLLIVCAGVSACLIAGLVRQLRRRDAQIAESLPPPILLATASTNPHTD